MLRHMLTTGVILRIVCACSQRRFYSM